MRLVKFCVYSYMSTQGVANYTASAKVAAEMEKSTDGLIDQRGAHVRALSAILGRFVTPALK